MTVSEKVILDIEGRTKGFEQIQAMFRQVTPLKKAIDDFRFVSERANSSMAGMFRMTNAEMGRFTQLGGTFKSRTVQMAAGVRRLFLGMQGFRMELLSVMFFGMGVAAVFKGFLQPALQAAGVFEVLSTTMQILFLPVALQILDRVALPLMDFFLGLSESTQLAIGAFVVLGAIFGTILGLLGALGLGIGGIISLFVGPFALISASALAAMAPVILIIGIVIAVIAALAIAWAFNLAGMRERTSEWWNGVSNTFGSVISIITDLKDLINAVSEGDFQGFLDAISSLWTHVKELFTGGIEDVLFGWQGWLLDLAYELATWQAKMIINMGIFFAKLVAGALGFGTDFVDGIVAGIKSAGARIAEAILGLIPNSVRGLPVIRRIVKDLEGVVQNSRVDALLKSSPNFSRLLGIPGGSGFKISNVNDFILQPGGRLIKTDPNDTIVGTKNGSPGGVTVNVTVNGPTFDHRRLVDLLKHELSSQIRSVTRG